MGNWDVSKPNKDGEQCGDAISRQAAIEEIRFGQSFITKIHPTGEIEHLFDKENKALETAVERIEALPSVTPKQEPTCYPPCIDCNKRMDEIRRAYDKLKEQESSDDAISRQALLDTIDRFCDLGKRQLKEIVRDLPPVLPIRQRGRWIFEEGDGKTCVDGYVCSACNKSFHTHVPYFAEYEFCPHCGAYMRESEG